MAMTPRLRQKTGFVDRVALQFSRVWPAGLSPVGPGTCGSAVATALAPWCFMPLPPGGRVAVLAVLFVVGGVASGRAERLLGRKDPGEVVIDEVLGQWLAYLPFAVLSPWWLVVGFALFRLFDIAKPWPVRSSENWLPGGFGIMIDDAVAGCYAMISLALIRLLMG